MKEWIIFILQLTAVAAATWLLLVLSIIGLS